jgi:hypothetical protein
MALISCVINVDTRPENLENKEMFHGVVSRDFIIDGVINKVNLFKGLDAEIIVFVDEHEPLTDKELIQLKALTTTLVIRKHNRKFEDNDNFPAFNDFNYIQAIAQARGKYIFHFDGDVAAFAISPEPIQEIIDLLEKYDYVSYPSLWSPDPVHDASFQGKYWASTRFFACKRETFNIGEIIKCQLDYDYWTKTYPMPRICHWLEHIIASHAWHKGKGVYYPPVDFSRFILFTWENYHKYTLQRLNSQSFEDVRKWVATRNFHYPNNLTI